MRLFVLNLITLLIVISGCATQDGSRMNSWYDDLDPTQNEIGKTNDWTVFDLDSDLAQWPNEGFEELGEDFADFW